MKFYLLFVEGLSSAIGSLRANKLRTALTMLGVAIGIFAITIIFTMVNSLNYTITKNLEHLGNTVMWVHHFPWTNEGLTDWHKYFDRPKVSYEDYQKLKRNLKNADLVVFELRFKNKVLKYKNRAVTGVGIRATTPGFIELNNFEIGDGRPFSEIEANSGRPVVILGHNVAKTLFGDIPAVGRYIRLEGKKLRVVGVMKKRGSPIAGDSMDDFAFMPYSFATRIFDTKNKRLDKVIGVRALNDELVPRVESEIIGLVRASRGLRPQVENDFSINKPEMIMSMVGTLTNYLQLGGFIISIFSIVVGGFGIGNIMFTTVKERTFEIGLRKAVGAPRGFILFQFMAEAILLCLAGGIIGLALQFGAVAVIDQFITAAQIDFQVVISGGSIVFGVIISLLIGLSSGIFPSLIAARMDPVESMRAS